MEILKYPIPTSGRLKSSGRIIEVIDKGKAAIAITGYTTHDAETDEKLFYNEISFFMGGVGGFGGPNKRKETGLSTRDYGMPHRQPDATMEYKTSEEQSALYRLNADREDIHIDPAAGKRSGFQQPILHGHCFMGIAGRHIYLKYGPYRRIKARFVGIVVPGNTLKTEMWQNRDRIMFQMTVVESGRLCIAGGWAELFDSHMKETARM